MIFSIIQYSGLKKSVYQDKECSYLFISFIPSVPAFICKQILPVSVAKGQINYQHQLFNIPTTDCYNPVLSKIHHLSVLIFIIFTSYMSLIIKHFAILHHIAPFYPNFRTKRYTLCTRYSAYFYRAVYRVCSASSTLFYCEQ